MYLTSRLAGIAGRVTSALSAPFRSLRTFRSARSNRAGARPHRRRAIGIAALITVFAVVTGGAVAYGAAHKTITLDVDGVVTRVSTYAGSVDGVLETRGIDVGARDTVAPETTSALHDGSEIVVRHATLVKVQVDGVETDLWTTAPSADEALETLAGRGNDVRLIASRSAAGGRADLPIALTLDGPVDVEVDGLTATAPDGSIGLAAVLDEFDVTLTQLDRVSVRHPETGAVTVVVNRVVVQDVTETLPIAFATVEQPNAGLYAGQKKVVTPGVAGQRVIVNRVTTVDGVETARELLSDTVTAAPVDQVVSVGTKTRPASVRGAGPGARAGAAPGSFKPDASNTGVPAGTQLTVHNGDLTINTAGTVIDGLDIRGFVKVNAPGVTIKNSIIRGTATSGQRALLSSTSDAANVTIQDSELYAANPSAWIDGIRGWNITARRVNIHDVIDSVHLYGNNTTLESSWLHNNLHFASDPNQGGGASHDDSIQIQIGRNIRITGNNISGAFNTGIQFTQDQGVVSDVQIVKNWLDGGGCTINVAEKGVGPFQGLVMTDNTFGRTTKVANCAIISPTTTVITTARNSYMDGAIATIHKS